MPVVYVNNDDEDDDDDDGDDDDTRESIMFLELYNALYNIMHATTIWAILSWKMCLVALAGSSPDQFVSDHNLIFSADFAGMRDIWTNFKRFDIQTEAQFIKVKRFDLGCNFEKTFLLKEFCWGSWA